jgi:hypothetical protein
MKRIQNIISAFIFLFSVSSFAQNTEQTIPQFDINKETKLITYSKVVPMDSTGKKELYHRAVIWINAYYKNPADVIRENDSIAGKIVCKHRFKITDLPNKEGFKKDAGLVQYALNLQFKDGRYRYDLTEINWKQLSYYPAERWMNPKGPDYIKDYDYYLIQTDETVKKVLASLEQAMTMNSVKEKKDDW